MIQRIGLVDMNRHNRIWVASSVIGENKARNGDIMEAAALLGGGNDEAFPVEYGVFERHAQYRSLLDAFTRMLAGAGSIVVLDGITGCGKTALLRVFGEHVARSGAVYLGASPGSGDRDVPFGVMTQLVRDLAFPAEDETRVAEFLGRVDPCRADGGPVCTEAMVPARMISDLCADFFAAAGARPEPLVLVIDGVEHADAASMRCLALLARHLPRSQVLIVLTQSVDTARTVALLEAELPAEPGLLRHLTLPPLSRAGVREMLARRLGRAEANRLATSCHAVSGGNPLLINGLIEDNRPSGGEVSGELRVGTGFEQSVLKFLYRSDTPAQEILRTAAVLGDASNPEVVGLLTKTEAGIVPRVLRKILGSGLLLADGKFRCPQAQETVLASLDPADLRRRHYDAAMLLCRRGAENSVVARHLIRSAQPEPHCVPLLLDTAEQALASHDMELAADCLRLAELAPTDPAVKAATRAIIVRMKWRVDPYVASRYLPSVYEAARAGVLGSEHLPGLINAVLWFGHTDVATELLEPGPAIRDVAAEASRSWAAVAVPGQRSRAEPGTAEEPRAQSARPANRIARSIDDLLTHGPDVHLIEEAECQLGEQRLSERTLATLLTSILTLLLGDRLATATYWCDQLSTQAEHARVPAWQAQFAALRAEIALRRGEVVNAEHQARRALTLMPPRSWGMLVGLPLSTLLQVGAGILPNEDLVRAAEEAMPAAMFHSPVGLRYLQARGRYRLANGQSRAALRDFEAVGELAVRWDIDVPAVLPWRSDAARVHLRLGAPEAAQALAVEQLERCADRHHRMRSTTLRVLAAAQPGRRDSLLEQADELLRGYPDPAELPHPLFDLSHTFETSGMPVRPPAELRGAPALAKALAPVALRAVPQAAGPVVKSPAAVLSHAEWRVAILAAGGLRNREIAARLTVTISTVEQHLTQVYRKLKIKRRELSLALARAESRYVS